MLQFLCENFQHRIRFALLLTGILHSNICTNLRTENQAQINRLSETLPGKYEFISQTPPLPSSTVPFASDPRQKINPKELTLHINSIGQREAVSPVLDENDDPVSTYTPAWDWSYNPRGELTEAEDKNGTAHRAYEYDSIGNRTKAIEALAADLAAAPANYVANAFNQYFQIKNPQSTIVNPVHDSDGNLQLDGGINKDSQAREYIWDGENRLIAVKRSDTNAALVTYQYDHHSRLIARSAGGITTRYLYEGWNRIAEYRQTGSGHDLEKSYLWGMDMSGSIQGAGGVGGLLMVSEISNSQISNYHPAYDGNGNVTEYLDANGNPVAHYEYDPFGKITVATGAQANNFAHRFSAKPLDEVTGWYYYGHRFYDPVTGRWPSRDPIGEETFRRQYSRGKSISERKRIAEAALAPAYVFVENQPVHSIDYLGLDRYITQFDLFDAGGSGGSQIHVGVAVDKWKIENGKYVKDGQVTFDFAADFLGEGLGEEDIIDEDQSIAWGNIDWWNIITSSIKGRGRIAKSDGLTLKAPITVPSSPCQDIKMLELLEKDLANPPFYSAIAHNCLFWAVGALQYGMDKPEIGKCCNPDGTIFTP